MEVSRAHPGGFIGKVSKAIIMNKVAIVEAAWL